MSFPRVVSVAFLVLVTVPPAGILSAQSASFVDVDALIRKVVKSQKLAEDGLAAYTFDQVEVETKYAKNGRPKESESRLFYVFSGEDGKGGSRELVAVNGRPATDDEKKKIAEEDAKAKQKRLEKSAAVKARTTPQVSGDDDDPLVGSRRLSELLARYEYRIEREEVEDGRLYYVLRFAPKRGLKSHSVAEQALSGLAGEVVVDGTDYQVKSVTAYLVSPVKVAGGLAARVDDAAISYEAQPILKRRWFPCTVDLRVRGKTAVFVRLDTGYRFQFSNFRQFGVETESAASAEPPPGP
jgi:hypothetical protein